MKKNEISISNQETFCAIVPYEMKDDMILGHHFVYVKSKAKEHGLTLVKRSTGYLVSQWDRHKFLENKVELEMFLKKLGVNL